MKKLKHLFLCILFSTVFFQIGSTQVYVESFENFNCPTVNCANPPQIIIDEDNCLPGWSTSHGTPSITNVAYDGDYNLLLEYEPSEISTPVLAEGAFMTDIEFLKNECYTISFWFKVGNTSTHEPVYFNIDLRNTLSHNDPNQGACLEGPPAQTFSQELYSEYIDLNYPNTSGYEQVIVEFSPSVDFNQLWFHLEGVTNPNGGIPAGVIIDYIEIFNCEFPCSSCGPSSTQIGGLDENGEGLVTYFSELNYVDGIFPTGCYEIQGTLIINNDAIAQDIDFVMAPGAEIIVEQGKVFNVNQSRFEGCLQLWDGITVYSEGALRLTDSKITDALHAIQMYKGASLELKNNIIENNHIGLYVRKGFITQIGDFENNMFVGGDDNLLPPFIDQIDFTFPVAEEPFAGILLNKVTGFTLGEESNPANVNTFSKLKNGIVAHASLSTEIYHCNMSFMIGEDPDVIYPFETLGGNGVVLNRCRGDNKIVDNTFEPIRIGVNANQSSASIIGNTMNSNYTGVIISQAIEKEILVQSNTISGYYLGMHITASTGASGINIIDNTIHEPFIGAWGGGGMLIDLTDGKAGDFNVTDNIIDEGALGALYGLRVSSSSYWQINQNQISSVGWGSFSALLDIQGSHHLQIKDNLLNGGKDEGIKVLNSPSVVYCCNTIGNNNIGVKFSGACGDTKFGTTTFNIHDTELLYDAVAITGPQFIPFLGLKVSNGNQWTENNPDLDAIHEGGSVIASLSEYSVIQSQGPNLNNVEPIGWFTSAAATPPITCEIWNNCGEEEWLLAPPVNKLDSVIANDELRMDNEVVPWLEEQRLYEKLVQHPELLKENALMQAFKNNLDNDEIGLLSQVRNSLNQSSDLTKLKDFNNTISTRSTIGFNEQTVNDLEIDYYQKVSFDADRLSQLYEIAIQCPLKAGNAVFRARSVYTNLTHKTLDWEQLGSCTTEQYKTLTRQKTSDEVEAVESLKIYPNPTTDFINIDLMMGESQARQISIFSIDGRTVFNQTIDTNHLQINVNDYPNGIYTVKVMTASNKFISKRFVVHH